MSWLSNTNFSGALTAVTQADAAVGGNANTLVPAIMASLTGRVSNTVTPMLNTIVANASDAGVVADMCTKIKEVPNLPAACVPLVDSLKAPGIPPLVVMQTVAAIETALANS